MIHLIVIRRFAFAVEVIASAIIQFRYYESNEVYCVLLSVISSQHNKYQLSDGSALSEELMI